MAAEHESKENAATEISQLLYWAALLGVSIGLNAKDIEDKL
jgi:phosphoribosyl-ATP pyrophosphohydrolase